MKFIAQLIKDSKLAIIKKNTKNNTIVTNINFKKAFSQERKIKLKKTSSQIFEEEKKPKKLIQSNLFNAKSLSQSQSLSKIDLKNNNYNNMGNILNNRQRETENSKKN